ncbi:hypothetical protein [Vulcaniibacterium tengchongense]|uniref:hypothetical protein n=1 Tax=Vulcaniibacterium tengchongense TaxID=1273429 RepID=UPI0013151934|nr:hypothetical protein [Vulcaniibacterium tengchongense]
MNFPFLSNNPTDTWPLGSVCTIHLSILPLFDSIKNIGCQSRITYRFSVSTRYWLPPGRTVNRLPVGATTILVRLGNGTMDTMLLLLLALLFLALRRAHARHRAIKAKPARRAASIAASARKPIRLHREPPWVRREIVRLKALSPDLGCRTLAECFNRQFGDRGERVSESFVAIHRATPVPGADRSTAARFEASGTPIHAAQPDLGAGPHRQGRSVR